jgi:hypothetical protein
MAHDSARFMQYRLEKATKRAMTSYNKYTGVVALVIESGMLYATSQVSKNQLFRCSNFPNAMLSIASHSHPQSDPKSWPVCHVEPANTTDRKFTFSCSMQIAHVP